MSPILQIKDLFIGPVYLVIIVFLLRFYKRKFVDGTGIESYFMPAFWLKMFFTVLFALVYQYYYDYGDTYKYYHSARYLVNLFEYEPQYLYSYFFHDISEYSYGALENFYYTPRSRYLFAESESTVIKITFFLNLLTFNSYLATAFLISTFAFLGCYKIFLIFYDRYAHLKHYLILATLYIPTVVFWGSAIMKDPLTLGALGFFVYSCYNLFLLRNYTMLQVIMLTVSAYLLLIIKSYILYTQLPAMLLWIYLLKVKPLVPSLYRPIVTPILIIVGSIVGLFLLRNISAQFNSLSLDQFANSVDRSRDWILYASSVSSGSSYDLGTFEPTIGGIIKMFPKAVNVTLFRPYIFEAGKLIIIPTAIENTAAILSLLFIMFRLGLKNFLHGIIHNPDILYCTIFVVLLGFIVGLFSFNFGTLVRYRIPLMPFFWITIILLYDLITRDSANKNKA